MFPNSLKLLTLYGFRVSVDVSWIFLAILITWTLAVGYFPAAVSGFGVVTYWSMAVLGAIGLFASIVLHELAHALVARRFDMPIRGITLFIFGGVAELTDEPPGPKAEFRVAIAGPIASFALSFVFFLVGTALAATGAGLALAAVFGYLAGINFLLAAFNLLPGFPLDGGRVLRAWLWSRTGSFRRATRHAATSGSIVAYALMGLGLFSVIAGEFIGGIWWFLIGMFLRTAAVQSNRQAAMRDILRGVRIGEVARRREPVTVAPSATVAELVENYFYVHHHKTFPVVEDGRLTGCVDLDAVKAVPREAWASTRVGDIAVACGPENTVDPAMDVYRAFRKMAAEGRGWLLVAEGDRLVGVISQSDISRYFAVRLDLEDADGEPAPERHRGTEKRMTPETARGTPSSPGPDAAARPGAGRAG